MNEPILADVELSDPFHAEYLLSAVSEGHHLTGCELGLQRALAVARGLALAGWRVTVQAADPHVLDPVIMEVWSEDVQS